MAFRVRVFYVLQFHYVSYRVMLCKLYFKVERVSWLRISELC